MLLYLGRMQGISPSLYEAADLDGASGPQKFFHITLPMITPIIFFDIITSTIGSFQIFQEAYVMTQNGQGGPVAGGLPSCEPALRESGAHDQLLGAGAVRDRATQYSDRFTPDPGGGRGRAHRPLRSRRCPQAHAIPAGLGCPSSKPRYLTGT